MKRTRAQLRSLLDDGLLEIPLPGSGSTPSRHLALLELARNESAAVARLAEAHVDAAAILAESGGSPIPGRLYGVWASESPERPLLLDREAATITGTKRFCSGVDTVDSALITASDEDGRRWLVEVALEGSSAIAATDDAPWSTPALADTATATMRFERHRVIGTLGPPDWYTERVGFWHGAVGPAACWAGAAIGLADYAELNTDEDPHRRAHLGGIRSLAWGMRAVLSHAGGEIDEGPGDVDSARYRAISVRHLVERSATELLDRFSRSLGPRPFTSDSQVAQRFADTHLYLRQNHAERDLYALAQLPPAH